MNTTTTTQNEQIRSDYITKYVTDKNPWETNSLLSRLTLSFMTPVIATVNKIGIDKEMIFKLPKEYTCEEEMPIFSENIKTLKQTYKKEIEETRFEDDNKKPNILFRAIFMELKFKVLLSALMMFGHHLIDYTLIYLMFSMISAFNNYNENGEREIQWGRFTILVIIRVIIKTFRPLYGVYQHFLVDNMICRKVHNMLKAVLFEKTIRKSVQRDKEFGAGEVTNLMDGDADEFSGIGWNALEFCKIPFELGCGCVCLGLLIGKAIIPTLICILIALFLNKLIAQVRISIEKRARKAGDNRLKTIIGVYNNIRYVKIAALEEFFLNKIMSKNNKMLALFRKKRLVDILMSLFNMIVRMSVVSITFASFWYFGGDLSIANVYTIWGIFERINGTVNHASNMLNWASRILVAARRLNNYICSEEIDLGLITWKQEELFTIDDNNNEEENAIEIENGNFYWTNSKQTAYLEVKKQEEKEKEEREKRCCNMLRRAPKKQIKAKEPEVTSMTNILSSEDSTLVNNTENKEKLVLKDINLRIKKGALVALIGKTGSGKTSLINSIFNEMFMQETDGQLPKINVNGTISYLSQNAKLMSKTIKENILFYNDFDEQRYKDAIHYSAMTNDLNILEDRDRTMLGDKGINLSGGQKTRLEIARSLYADKEIVIMDDPISALDINVGKFIMEETIKGYLKDKTRIIATHAIAYLKYFDYIYVMDEGRIIAEGDYSEIKKTKEYKQIQQTIEEESKKRKEKQAEDDEKAQEENKFVKKEAKEVKSSVGCSPSNKANNKGKKQSFGLMASELRSSNDSIDEKTTDESSHSNSDNESTDEKQEKIELKEDQADLVANIIEDEEKGDRKMNYNILKEFINLRGGMKFVLFQSVFIIFCKYLNIKIAWFIQEWGTSANRDIANFLIWISVFNIGEVLVRMVYGFILNKKTIEVSKKIGFYTNFKLIHASVNKFWDRVPIGRVINRLTSDSSEVDNSIPDTQNHILEKIGDITKVIILSTVALHPLLWIFVAIYFLVCYKLYNHWVICIRLEDFLYRRISTTKNQLIRESLQALTEVRVYGIQNKIMKEFYRNTNTLRSLSMLQFFTHCWLHIRVQFWSCIITIPGVIMMYYFVPTVGMLALILSNVFDINHHIMDLLHTKGRVDYGFIAFERIKTYMDVAPEVGYNDLNKTVEAFEHNVNLEEKKVNTNLFKKGKIEINNLEVRYRENTKTVLNGINLKVNAGEKIGIVGRTGAGKTTLISSIYKSFQNYEGSIKIDNHDISKIDLKTLRSNMTVIPQDPQLFNTTLKKNLDPYNKFDNNEIIKILKDFDIWNKFNEDTLEKKGLDFKVESEGGNLSQGEKQLLCMTRALLNRTKIILLDEATANIDNVTEAKIQNAVKEYFKDSTILMIAHRLNTIMFCDKVLVLDKGTVKEFGSISELKNDESSHFGKMVSTTEEVEKYLG